MYLPGKAGWFRLFCERHSYLSHAIRAPWSFLSIFDPFYSIIPPLPFLCTGSLTSSVVRAVAVPHGPFETYFQRAVLLFMPSHGFKQVRSSRVTFRRCSFCSDAASPSSSMTMVSDAYRHRAREQWAYGISVKQSSAAE